jgi:uncharacterized membrane protein
MRFPNVETPESLVEMQRLHGLSDAVFAVALTLLVLEIRVPEGVPLAGLAARLGQLAPRLLVYLISFAIIGGAWGSHQRMLGQIQRGDGLLVWLNLLSLLWVTLLPASATLLGQYPEALIATVCFAVNVVLIQLAALWLWSHASRNGLTNPGLDPRVVDGVGRRLGLSAIAFGVSMALAVVNVAAAFACWVAVFAILFTTDWLSWQQATKMEEVTIPLDGARATRIHIAHAAGRLNIQGAPGFDGLIRGVCGGGLETAVQRAGDIANVSLEASAKRGFLSLRYPWAWAPANSLDWTLQLSTEVPMALDLELAGGQASLQLGEARVTEIKVEAAASTVEMALPDHAGKTAVKIEASAASFVLRVPTGVRARIELGRWVASFDIDVNRFPMLEEGRLYQSAGYASAEYQADIRLQLSMSSVKIVQG